MTKENTALKPIDAPIFGYFSALYRSFFSSELYVDIGKRWRGLGLRYLVLVIAILSIPFAMRVGINFSKTFEEDIVEPLKQVPTLYVQNGQISTDKPMPYLVKNAKGKVVLIVDTTGKVTGFTKEYPSLTILINKDVINFRLPTPNLLSSSQAPSPNTKPIVQRLDKSMNTVFSGEKFIDDQSIFYLKLTSLSMIYPVILVALTTFFVIIFLALALLAQIFASIFFTFQISYATACRLLIVAATPMLLLLFIALSLSWSFMGLGALLIAIFVIYYTFALFAYKGEMMRVARL